MNDKPLIVLSYSGLMYCHDGYTDDELDKAIYWTGAAWEHIVNDDNSDAQYQRDRTGKNPHARVKPFIAKARCENRFRRVTTLTEFNEVIRRFDLPQIDDDRHKAPKPTMAEHLRAYGYRVVN